MARGDGQGRRLLPAAITLHGRKRDGQELAAITLRERKKMKWVLNMMGIATRGAGRDPWASLYPT